MGRLSKETIDSLYSESYQKILTGESKTHRTVMRTFALLLYQREPLTLDAILSAVVQAELDQRTRVGLSDLLKMCKGMVMFDSNMNMLRFIHASAQEFLERQPDLDAPRGNQVLASSCISMCTYGSPVGLDIGVYPTKYFYHYSVLYWAEHLRMASTADYINGISSLLKEFVFDDKELNLSFITWTKAAGALSEALPNHHLLKRALSAVSSPISTPLFAACVFGLGDILKTLAVSGFYDWNQKNSSGQTGLYLACAYGHDSVVEILLTHRTHTNAIGGQYGNPLQAACFKGHYTIAERILKHAGDPNAEGKYENAVKASIAGDNEDIAILVLNHGFQIADRHAYDDLVEAATLAGHIRVVQYLQKAYIASYAKSHAGQDRAIESAIFKGKLPVLQDLSKSLLPNDCVAIAALGGQNRIVTFLLDQGHDVELEGQFGTPLRSASIMGHETTVHLLLDRGANINTLSKTFGDALQAAAGRGHLSVTKLFLFNGAEIKGYGGFYRCALQAAAHQGHIEVVKTLLAAGADFYQVGHFKDVFHAAADGAREQIAQLLLDSGFRYRLPPGRLMAMACKSNPGFGDLLRASSPSRNNHKTNIYPRSFLPSTTSLKLNPEIRAYIGENAEKHQLRSGGKAYADLTGFDRDRVNNALQNAASQGHRGIVNVILSGWDTLGAKALSSETEYALFKGASNGHIEVVKLLINHQSATIPSLERASKQAVLNGYPLIVKVLIEKISQLQSLKKMLSGYLTISSAPRLPRFATHLTMTMQYTLISM